MDLGWDNSRSSQWIQMKFSGQIDVAKEDTGNFWE